MWCLLGCHGEALQGEHRTAGRGKGSKGFGRSAGLISEAKHGQSIALRVEDKGWRWASEHLRDELPPNFRVLQQWLGRVSRFSGRDRPTARRLHRAAAGIAARCLRQEAQAIESRRSAKPKKGEPPSPAELRRRIEEAYLAITNGRKAESVPLGKLRAQLADSIAQRWTTASCASCKATTRRGLARSAIRRL